MKESAVERRLVNGIKNAGGFAWKFVSPGHSGVPDRIVLLPGGYVFFVELKTESGRLTPLQIDTHNKLRALGFDVRTLYGKSYVEGFLHEIQSLALSKGSGELGAIAQEMRVVFRDGTWQNCDYTDGCKEAAE